MSIRPYKHKNNTKNQTKKKIAKIQEPSRETITSLIAAFNATDWASAIKIATLVTNHFPNYAFGWKALGIINEKTGNKYEAIINLQKSAILNDADPEIFYNIGILQKIDGDISAAETSFKRAIQLNPTYGAAYNNLGAIYLILGRNGDAIDALLSAVKYAPGSVDAHINLGNAFWRELELPNAKSSFEKALHLQPNSDNVLNSLGGVICDLGKIEDSLVYYRKAIEINPTNFHAHNNLGVSLFKLKRHEEAQKAFEEAMRINRLFPEAICNLANVYRVNGQLKEAESAYREAIKLNNNYINAYNNLGITLHDQKRFIEARSCYEIALRLNPSYAEVYNNLAVTYQSLGMHEDACKFLKIAVSLNKNYAEAYSNLANSMRNLKLMDDAQKAIEKAIALDNNLAAAHNNLGNLLEEIGLINPAINAYKKAIEVDPSFPNAHNNMGNVLKDSHRYLDAILHYKKAIALNPDDSSARSNLIFCMNIDSSFSNVEACEAAKFHAAAISSMCKPKFTHEFAKKIPSKIRIGFVSGDFLNHPVSFFLESLLSNIDYSKFELFAFTTNPKRDDTTDRLNKLFSKFYAIYGMNDFEAAEQIYNLDIHILFDLSGHTAHNRLNVFSYKPAPLQISWLGYFATTGLPEIDFILGDPFVSPDSDTPFFTERIFNLPESYLCFTPPNIDVSVGDLPANINGFVTFGSFNNLSKISSTVIATWSKILHAVPKSKLFLKTKYLSDPSIISSIIEKFDSHKVSSDRLILEGSSPRAELLNSYNRVDIALDSFPYPGGTTSAEALWMGVPVLTLKGDRFLSRVGESIACNAGHPEWIARDIDSYINSSIALASDLECLGDIRRGLRAKVIHSPLFNAQRFAKNFENAVKLMWDELRP